MVRWFLDADDDPDSHQNLLLLFGPFTIFLEICMQIHSVVKFACKFIPEYLRFDFVKVLGSTLTSATFVSEVVLARFNSWDHFFP